MAVASGLVAPFLARPLFLERNLQAAHFNCWYTYSRRAAFQKGYPLPYKHHLNIVSGFCDTCHFRSLNVHCYEAKDSDWRVQVRTEGQHIWVVYVQVYTQNLLSLNLYLIVAVWIRIRGLARTTISKQLLSSPYRLPSRITESSGHAPR